MFGMEEAVGANDAIVVQLAVVGPLASGFHKNDSHVRCLRLGAKGEEATWIRIRARLPAMG